MKDQGKTAYISYSRGKMRISTPYDPGFVTALKEKTATRKWSKTSKEWTVDPEDYPAALKIIEEYFGKPVEREPEKKPAKFTAAPEGYLEAWIDGACDLNPGGTGAYGLVVKRNRQALIKEHRVVGKGPCMTNNVAEYCGLIALLEWYKAQKISEPVLVRSDSTLLINQVNGVWRARNGDKQGLYYDYYQKAIRLLNEIGRGHFRFEWVRREQNTEADDLSKGKGYPRLGEATELTAA